MRELQKIKGIVKEESVSAQHNKSASYDRKLDDSDDDEFSESEEQEEVNIQKEISKEYVDTTESFEATGPIPTIELGYHHVQLK